MSMMLWVMVGSTLILPIEGLCMLLRGSLRRHWLLLVATIRTWIRIIMYVSGKLWIHNDRGVYQCWCSRSALPDAEHQHCQALRSLPPIQGHKNNKQQHRYVCQNSENDVNLMSFHRIRNENCCEKKKQGHDSKYSHNHPVSLSFSVILLTDLLNTPIEKRMRSDLIKL